MAFPRMQTLLLRFSHDQRHLADSIQHAANLTMEWNEEFVFHFLADRIVPVLSSHHPGSFQLLESIFKASSRADKVNAFHD